MKQNLNLICEAEITLGKMMDEGQSPSGLIEAKVTTFGKRIGADGRKFFYKPEGFAQWADEFSTSNKPLPMFLNHNDMGMPVGQWDEFMMEDDGMSAKGRIYMNTVGGSDLYSVLKESPKMFGGVSVGAYADEACMVDEDGMPTDDEEEGYFQITKGGLREVSVVMYPNNPNAEIHKLEYFDKDGKANPRLIEKTLRDAGLSKKDATTASSILKKVFEMRDASKDIIKKTSEHGEHDAVEKTEAQDILKLLEERELLKALSNRIK
jgi:HK97 family phage prohead protease